MARADGSSADCHRQRDPQRRQSGPLPRTTDFMCDRRRLRLPDFALLRERLGFNDVSQGLLGITTSDLGDMAGTPLSQLRPAEYFTAAEKGAVDGSAKGCRST